MQIALAKATGHTIRARPDISMPMILSTGRLLRLADTPCLTKHSSIEQLSISH
jgi:hypothetical protein